MILRSFDVHEKVPLSLAFYERDDVVQIARDLIGCYLITKIDGVLTAGLITETEAYNGRTDRACHAYGKRTKRTETLYQRPGVAYIYLCYGIHHLFNVVTNVEGKADAVLIRSIEPVMGQKEMELRRGGRKGYKLTSGPGSLSQALGIKTSMSRTSIIDSETIWIANKEENCPFDIQVDRRVGVDYAGEDALLPWRFFIKGNKWVSKQMQKSVIN